MSITTSAGSILSIGAALPGTYDKTGFEAVTWTKIGEVTNVPEFGKVYELVTHNPIDSRRTVKKKGSFNDGSTNLEYAYDEADSGQAALIAAVDSDDSLPYRIQLPNGKNVYFQALSMGNPINIGTVNQITSMSTTLEIDNQVLIEDAP